MRKSKLIELLKGVSKKELREIGHYISTPLFNRSKNVIALFKYIKKHYPEFTTDKLSKEYVFARVFTERIYNDKKMRNCMSQLSILIEDYLVWVSLKERNIGSMLNREYVIMQALKKRQLTDLFFKSVKAAQKIIDGSTQKDVHYHFHKFKLNDVVYRHPNTPKITSHNTLLYQTLTDLELFYFATKLAYSCEVKTRAHFTAEHPIPTILLDEMLPLITETPFKDSPLISIYAAALRFLLLQNETHYFQLKTQFTTHMHILAASEKDNFLTLLINYANLMDRNGQKSFLEELFELYQLGLNYQILISNQSISTVIFYNIVQVSCSLKKFDNTYSFITSYHVFLPDEDKGNMKNLCLSYLLFSQNKLKAALTQLALVQPTNFMYTIVTKFLQVAIYYEGEDNFFSYDMYDENILESFPAYIRRQTNIAPSLKEAILEFISFVKNKLFKFKCENAISKVNLQDYLNSKPNIAYRTWLCEKVAELPN